MLEHVTHRELALESIVRHVHDDGCFLFSTPSGSAENLIEPAWEHHRVEYCAASLYDFLSRYSRITRRSDAGMLPNADVFDQLKGSGVDYLFWLNPVLCEKPIKIVNPYRPVSS
jgi:2-polyprenyl-3-methyl-5-hydroxy-6-metoxy-1,4-benzoquinol methylase